NLHPNKSMPTYNFRPNGAVFVRVSGLTLILAASFSGLRANTEAGQAQDPNRPPWAQKGKSATANASPPQIVMPDAAEPIQDRNKIKVSVNLVNVLVSVLDEHNRPAPDLP